MKKSIIFVSYPFVCGGVEKSLLSILTFLPSEQFDVTLMLTEKKGDLLPYVPSWIKVVEVPFAPMDRYELQHGRKATLKYALTHFHWIHAMRMLCMRIVWRITGSKGEYNVCVIRAMLRRVQVDVIPRDFDFAFAYAGRYLAGLIVSDLIRSSVKGIWCHDETAVGSRFNSSWSNLHSRFTHRFATRQLCERLNKNGPDELPPFEVMPYNIDSSLVHSLADSVEGFKDSFDGIRILTVGRLSKQKGLDDAIRIAARLKSEGLKFRWYVVGEGEERNKLEGLISKNDISDCFVLLGQFVNPYPFFKGCDIYAQPSRYEAYCITIAEARLFNKPIVLTDFVGAREQIEDGRTGLITPIGDVDAFHDALKVLILDKKKRNVLSQELSKESADSTRLAQDCWKKLLGY